jgi:hypothetical protein
VSTLNDVVISDDPRYNDQTRLGHLPLVDNEWSASDHDVRIKGFRDVRVFGDADLLVAVMYVDMRLDESIAAAIRTESGGEITQEEALATARRWTSVRQETIGFFMKYRYGADHVQRNDDGTFFTAWEETLGRSMPLGGLTEMLEAEGNALADVVHALEKDGGLMIGSSIYSIVEYDSDHNIDDV